MKKIYLIITILILITTSISCSAQICKDTNKTSDEWTGKIRIEGNDNTVWTGIITVSDSNIFAKNVTSGVIEEFYISYPSVLGALDEASKIGGFSYVVEYWPDWNAFLIKTIEIDSEWWHYWVDFELPMVGVGQYELSDDDEILIGYLENWYAHALKISVDKNEVKKGEKFTISVFNETDNIVEEAKVYIGEDVYTTDVNGTVKVAISKKGNYAIYAEKDEYVRSEKKNIQVKIKSKYQSNRFISMTNFLQFFLNQRSILKHLINH